VTFTVVTFITGVVFVGGQLSLNSPMSELENHEEDSSD